MAKEKLYKDLPRPKLTRAQISSIYRHLQSLDPAPRTELNYSNPYTLVVAVALSAQSTDVGVNKATKALFEKADTPEKMVALGEDNVRDHIKTIGLYKNKATNVIKLSKMLINDFGSVVPGKMSSLTRLLVNRLWRSIRIFFALQTGQAWPPVKMSMKWSLTCCV